MKCRGTSCTALCLIVVLTLAGAAIAQTQPTRHGPINPPARPATPITGRSGRLLSPTVSLPAPNNTTWTALGPASLNAGVPTSGRITGIAVDPTNSSNIYIAAAGGGVWQSTDGGSTYNPLTDTQNTLAMGAIAIAPSNHSKIYAGTGEANNSGDSNFGQGILVSNDGGATWTLSTGPGGVFNRLAIAKISVDPTNPNNAYAAVNDYAENGLCCSNTGIYHSTDGGSTWTNATTAIDSSRPWSDVVVDPNSTNIIYAAHGNIFSGDANNGVYRSTDGGLTWSLLTNAPNGTGIGRIALTVAPSANAMNHHVLYVAIAYPLPTSSVLQYMMRSDNADAATPTFTDLTAGTPNFGGSGGQGWYDWIIAVDPANSANIYCAGALDYNTNSHHVIRSTDSGATWTDITNVSGVQPHTDSHAMAFDSSSRLLLGNDGGIWRFDPTGPSWTDLNGDLNTIQFTGIGLHPTSNQTVLGGSQDNGTELTTGSTVWNAVDGGDGGYSQISQTNANICYSNHPIGSFGPTSFFRVSTDGCNTWTAQTPSISDSSKFDFYAPIFVDPSNGNRVFLGGDALYESADAASTWSTHTSPSTNAIDAIAVLPGGNSIYISTGGTFASSSQIWLSTDDGSTWTQHSLPAGAGRVQELDIDPNDNTGATVIAVINTFNTASAQVYRTTNSGGTWSDITGNLPTVPAWSAKIDTDTNHTIYVSNETGVYSAPSPGGTWTAVGSGLPNAQGVHLELNSSLQLLALATHGRGAWYFSTAPGGGVAPAITSANNTTFTVGVAGTFTVTTTGTPTPSITESGTLPTGVTFLDNGNGTGTLSGTPAPGTGGVYPITFTASNGVGSPATQSFTLTVDQPPAITSANATTFLVGTLGSFTVTTTGYPPPSIMETGALPSGVTFMDNGNGTGTLSGTPAPGTGGVYNITFTASNGVGSPAVQSFTLTVDEPASFTSPNHATFTIGVYGSFTVTTLGFPKPSITEKGHLPTGITFVDNGNGTGTLHGTPLVFDGGDFSISFTATNGIGSPATQPFTIILQQAPAFTSANNAVFVYGVPNSFTVTTVGFPAPSIHEAGTLPPWLTFVDNGNGTATLSGTPSYDSGTFPLVLTATNVVTTATQNFTLVVSGLKLSPPNLSFGFVYLNSSHTLPVTVTNVGSMTVSISGVSITPGTAPAGAYTFVNHCGSPLLAGKSCIIDVTFKAKAEGTLTATLNLMDNAVGMPQHVGLTGNVIDPVAKFSPTKLAFGTQAVHSSTTLTVQLTNSGQTPLDISGISIGGADAGDFSQTNNCPAIMAAGTSCTISVTFDPAVKGVRSGMLIVADNVAAGQSTVALTGTGH